MSNITGSTLPPDHAADYNSFLLPILLLWSIFIWAIFLKKGRKLNLPPSPPPLPIIGNLHQLGSLPFRSFQDFTKKYGPLVLLHLGQQPALIVSSSEMAREVTKIHDVVFSNRPQTIATDIIVHGHTDIAFSSYGPYWRQAKKISHVELFSQNKVQSTHFIREEEVASMINKIRGASLKKETVNLSAMIVTVVNNIITRTVFSHKAEDEHGVSKYGEIARGVMTTLLTAPSFGDFFPHLKWLDHVTGHISGMKAASREMDAFFDRVIDDHRVQKNKRKDNKDFLDMILQLQEEGQLSIELSQDNIKSILVDMFIAGTDTTATTIEWAMAEVLKNGDLMKKVQAEVRFVVGKKSKIDVNDINKMHYLKCVVKETLRLHPAVPFLIPRETSASVSVAGYDIPPKTRVFVNTWAIQRDPKSWPERPEEFFPERFEKNSIDYKGRDHQFIPFGSGRRSCPGTLFGITSVEYVMANLLYWFNWKLVEDKMDMGETFGLTLYKKVPLNLVPTLHSP